MRLLLLISIFCISVHGQQTLNIQVSDTANNPVKGLRITTKAPGTTGTTDDAGKTTLTFNAGAGSVELTIVSPAGWDFISPWQRSVVVPPNYWSIVIARHGQRKILESNLVIRSLAARTNELQYSKAVTIFNGQFRVEGAPSSAPGEANDPVIRVAAEVGVDPEDLRSRLKALATEGADEYERGLGLLLERKYDVAAKLFSVALDTARKREKEDQDGAADSAYFLGKSLFEMMRYSEASNAFQEAGRFRPNDAFILENLGLSEYEAGDPSGMKRYLEELEKRFPNTGWVTVQT